MEQEEKETQNLIQLLLEVDRQNAALHPKQSNTPTSISAPGHGPSASNIQQEASTGIGGQQFLKQLNLIAERGVKEDTTQTDGYIPDIFDFMEGSSMAGITDKLDRYHQLQAESPLAQHPRPEPRRPAPVYPIKPSARFSHIAGNANALHGQAARFPTPAVPTNPNLRTHANLPTPPYSPYQFTHGRSPFSSGTTHHGFPYPTPSTAPKCDRTTTSFTTPMSRMNPSFGGMSVMNPSFGSKSLDTPVIQAMNGDQSPNGFVRPADDGIDPFLESTQPVFQGQLPMVAPTTSLAAHDPFKPSRALLDLPRSIDPDLAYMAQRVGLDLGSNYKGDITKEHIYNAIAPVSDNCALHIIGLPADITLKEVFSVIVGKVFSFQLHRPVPGKWTGCGARLVFTNRTATEEFYWKARSGFGIVIRGQQIRVLWNRDPCRPQHYADRNQSRVLQITGPNHPNFSAQGMEEFFRSKLLFDLVERKEYLAVDGSKVVELHFPSILGQSRPAMKQFYEMLDETQQRNFFKIHYAADPCDPAVRGSSMVENYRF